MAGLKICCISPQQILHDLTDCVTTTPSKVNKRVNRLNVVCKLLKLNDDYIFNLKLCKEYPTSWDPDDIQAFVNTPLPYYDSNVVLFGDETKNDSIKKLIESELTSNLNSDLELYIITCGIVRKMFFIMSRTKGFKTLIETNRIILVHKGGVAQRLILLSKYPEHEIAIKRYFALGGDNDCCLYIDPSLSDYTDIHKQCVTFVWDYMVDYLPSFAKGIVNQYANQVKSINIIGKNYPVKACSRRSFTINCPTSDIPKHHMIVMDQNEAVFASRNDTLEFNDEIGRLCKFSLLRYKKAFLVGNRMLGAEILDISIPYMTEVKSAETFHEFKSGAYIDELFLQRAT